MYPPPPAQHCYDHDRFSGAAFFPEPGIPPPAGISLAGSLNRETGKLESLPPDLLERMIPGYDLVLLEGDGSRNLPLKGWAEYEPVVPLYTTATVAVIPISPLGKQVSPDLVFRIPQFTALCGAAPGDTLRPAHLAAVIAGGPASAPGGGAVRGLFHAARGERVLLINQADNEEQREQARTLAALLPRRVAPDLAAVLAASVALNQAEILRETPALPRTDSAP
jgi:probable selenium-dependent hydroxylase accessory protein YqeC